MYIYVIRLLGMKNRHTFNVTMFVSGKAGVHIILVVAVPQVFYFGAWFPFFYQQL